MAARQCPRPRPVLLDLCCGGGGAGAGYFAAGFNVIGCDIISQPKYPYEFVLGDALKLLPELLRDWTVRAIHVSPPCKIYTRLRPFSGQEHYDTGDLIVPFRQALQDTGLPYVIENVPGAPLINPIQLCGSSFDLGVRRERLFECNFPVTGLPCNHARQDALSPGYLVKTYKSDRPRYSYSSTVGVYGKGQGLGAGELLKWQKAMGDVDWMGKRELAEAIPPAYTRHVGRYLMSHVLGMV